MLTKIRQGTDNILVKIILWIIALSFVGIGGASFIGGNSAGNLVIFDNIKPISVEEFQVEKAREIDLLQRQNGINLTEENIAEIGLDSSVMARLIHNSLIKYLASHYNFDISEDSVIKIISKTPYFKNDSGKFDLSLFKHTIANSPYTEKEYIQNVKNNIFRQMMVDIFKESFLTPKIMVDNAVNYMAETKVADLLIMSLDYRPANYKPEPIEIDEVKKFYENNQELFAIPELRTFDYIKIDKNFIAKRLKISDSEIKEFFESNKDEFTEKNYIKAKKQAQEMLTAERLDELTTELAKNIEEDISTGLLLPEISKKYGIKISPIKDASFSELNSDPKSEMVELAYNAFEMIEGELSYPIEIADKNEILVINLQSITNSRQKALSEVEDSIRELIERRQLASHNLKEFKEINKNYDPKKFDIESLKKKGVDLIVNKSFTRSEAFSQEKVPADLINAIFNTKKNETTAVSNDNKKFYAAYIKSSSINKSKADNIRSKSKDNFDEVIKEGIFQELLLYISEKNNMKIIQKN